jgi:hypothetical protein
VPLLAQAGPSKVWGHLGRLGRGVAPPTENSSPPAGPPAGRRGLQELRVRSCTAGPAAYQLTCCLCEMQHLQED